MIIHFGTGSYTLKSYTPIELGLPITYTQDAEFRIKQKYFEIYWIPIFAIGVAYTVRHKGGTVEYEVSPEIADSMRQMGYPKWKKSLAFAAPLLALVISLSFGALTSIQSARYESNYAEMMVSKREQEKAFKANPDGFAKYAAQAQAYDSLLQLIADQSELNRIEIDTTFEGLLKLAVKMEKRDEDAQNSYTMSNCIFYTANANNSNSTFAIPKNYLQTSFANTTGIMNHYMDYLLGVDSILQAGSSIENLRVAFDGARYKQYFVVTNFKGVEKPRMLHDGGADFTTGVALANVKVYDIEKKVLVESFDVLATNDDQINLRKRSSGGHGNMGTDFEAEAHLLSNLVSNVNQEVMEELGLTTKNEGEEVEVSTPEPIDDKIPAGGGARPGSSL